MSLTPYREPGEQCDAEPLLDRAWLPVEEAMEYAKRHSEFYSSDKELLALPVLFPGFPATPGTYCVRRGSLSAYNNLKTVLSQISDRREWNAKGDNWQKYWVATMPKALYTDCLMILRVARDYYMNKQAEYRGLNPEIVAECADKLKEIEQISTDLVPALQELIGIGDQLVQGLWHYDAMFHEVEALKSKVAGSRLESEKALPGKLERDRSKYLSNLWELYGARGDRKRTYLSAMDDLVPTLNTLIAMEESFKVEYWAYMKRLITEMQAGEVETGDPETALVAGGDTWAALMVRRVIRGRRTRIFAVVAILATAGWCTMLDHCGQSAAPQGESPERPDGGH